MVRKTSTSALTDISAKLSEAGPIFSSISPSDFKSLSYGDLKSIEGQLQSFSDKIGSICTDHCVTVPFVGTRCINPCS